MQVLPALTETTKSNLPTSQATVIDEYCKNVKMQLCTKLPLKLPSLPWHPLFADAIGVCVYLCRLV
jgi:hypothetical protein